LQNQVKNQLFAGWSRQAAHASAIMSLGYGGSHHILIYMRRAMMSQKIFFMIEYGRKKEIKTVRQNEHVMKKISLYLLFDFTMSAGSSFE
jgi:hypothetical protein